MNSVHQLAPRLPQSLTTLSLPSNVSSRVVLPMSESRAADVFFQRCISANPKNRPEGRQKVCVCQTVSVCGDPFYFGPLRIWRRSPSKRPRQKDPVKSGWSVERGEEKRRKASTKGGAVPTQQPALVGHGNICSFFLLSVALTNRSNIQQNVECGNGECLAECPSARRVMLRGRRTVVPGTHFSRISPPLMTRQNAKMRL